MCIAIVQNPGVKIPMDRLDTCAVNNDDGAGYAFIMDGRIKIVKSVQWKHIRKRFRRDVNRFGNDSPFLIHFRIATHGSIAQENCHPFPVKDAALIHNGMLPNCSDKSKSDTAQFAAMLSELPDGWADSERFMGWLADSIGYNKVAMLWPDGRYAILNEKKGDWLDGAWYSNSTWKPRQTVTTNPTRHISRYSPTLNGSGSGIEQWRADANARKAKEEWEQGKVWFNRVSKYIWPYEKTYLEYEATRLIRDTNLSNPEIDALLVEELARVREADKSAERLLLPAPASNDGDDDENLLDDFGRPTRDTLRTQPNPVTSPAPVGSIEVHSGGYRRVIEQEIEDAIAAADEVIARHKGQQFCPGCGEDVTTVMGQKYHDDDLCAQVIEVAYGRSMAPQDISAEELSLLRHGKGRVVRYDV